MPSLDSRITSWMHDHHGDHLVPCARRSRDQHPATRYGSWQPASSHASSTAPTDSSVLETTSWPAARRCVRVGRTLSSPDQPPGASGSSAAAPATALSTSSHRRRASRVVEPWVRPYRTALIHERRDRPSAGRDPTDEPAADAHRPRPLPERRSVGVGDRVGTARWTVHGGDPAVASQTASTRRAGRGFVASCVCSGRGVPADRVNRTGSVASATVWFGVVSVTSRAR